MLYVIVPRSQEQTSRKNYSCKPDDAAEHLETGFYVDFFKVICIHILNSRRGALKAIVAQEGTVEGKQVAQCLPSQPSHKLINIGRARTK